MAKACKLRTKSILRAIHIGKVNDMSSIFWAKIVFCFTWFNNCLLVKFTVKFLLLVEVKQTDSMLFQRDFVAHRIYIADQTVFSSYFVVYIFNI